MVTFGIQWLLAESPSTVAVALTNFFANKGVGVLTNVPGPSTQMTFVGHPGRRRARLGAHAAVTSR